MKIDLESHLEKLVKEWVAKGYSLKRALEPLEQEGQYVVENDMPPQDVVQVILIDLGNLGEIDNLQKYLEEDEDARKADLWGLLSEYHPSSLD